MEHQERRAWRVTVTTSTVRLMLASYVYGAIFVALRFVPGVDRHLGAFMGLATVSGFVVVGLTVVLNRGKVSELEMSSGSISCAGKTLQRSTLTCELAVWNDRYLHSRAGSALVLRDTLNTLYIGGRDDLTAEAASRASVNHVDATLARDAFTELLDALNVDRTSSPVHHERGLIIELMPSGMSARGIWHSMGAWLCAMAVVAVVNVFAGLFQADRSPIALFALHGLTVVVLIAGAVATFLNGSRRPAVRERLRIDGREVTLEEARDPRAAVSSGPPLQATRHFYRSSTRFSSVDIPSLRLTWSSGRRTVIGVWNPSMRWASKVPRLRKLDYIIGPEEWRRLIAALRLA